MISFGTDGWRAVIADTFTFANLHLVSQAVADAINESADGNASPEVVIGYDTRFLSDRFAIEVARVMAGNGIVAWLSRSDVPTPAVSYNVVEKKADATPAAPAAGEREIRYYRNPMGLPDISPVPKKDSMGMDYIPVYEEDVAAPAGTGPCLTD